MRDWDTYDYDIFVCFNNVDYITYEGLRLTKILVLDIKIPGLHYLWGIETVITWYKSSYIIRSMDYITYEGLRHCQTFSKFSSFLVDYITYEGLRHLLLPKFDSDEFSDYITYEGLRLINHGFYIDWRKRITLPMRDWDFIPPWKLLPLIYGLHYLWGIETLFLFHVIYLLERITLPMRDWD